MVLTPIRRSRIPSPLEDQRAFDDFITQYLNKCDDLLSYTKRYPIVKESPIMTVQRQNRNPHEEHRWLRRDVYLYHQESSYDELKQVLFTYRADHLPLWMPQLLSVDRVESIVPNLCQISRYSFKSQGLKANRDYCQLVVMREFLGDTAKPKPRIFTPSASMANLAMMGRNQSSTSLVFADNAFSSRGESPVDSPLPVKALKSVRSMADFQAPHFAPSRNQFAGLTQAPHDMEVEGGEAPRPIRRFQVVTVPVEHTACGAQKGFVRAFYESYEEVREYSDGHVEWSCIHHSDFSGWVPAFMADHSIAVAFPREAEALLEYVGRVRRGQLSNE
ncbi:hypothetical protein H4218_005154 [Coemansia sp. IMI 209128]|nr:hypothetical protein GGI06_002854 [Coemansia sp. S85]KAJ2412910.1 hypothetical protein GGI10_003397 [Coemansia sp. RSA 2530]KAJ2695598.1 hypothetical protein H4218_005154 [Coemansia sp. IMI 209128]